VVQQLAVVVVDNLGCGDLESQLLVRVIEFVSGFASDGSRSRFRCASLFLLAGILSVEFNQVWTIISMNCMERQMNTKRTIEN
jgi:hypothetical protein